LFTSSHEYKIPNVIQQDVRDSCYEVALLGSEDWGEKEGTSK